MCPGRDAARSTSRSAASQNRDPGSSSRKVTGTPALQRTAPQGLLAAPRPGNKSLRKSAIHELVNVYLSPSPNLAYPARVLFHRGAFRERHGRGAGCGGRGSVRREGSDGAGPAGPVSCKPDADVRRWRGRLRRVVPVSRVAPRPNGEPDPTGKGNLSW